jgi:hypothetical protein
MSTLSIRLPQSLHERVRELAAREGVSINQLIAAALGEKMSALMTADYLEARARRGTCEKFLAALDQVPDVDPESQDRLPVGAPGDHGERSRDGSGSTKARRRPSAGRRLR